MSDFPKDKKLGDYGHATIRAALNVIPMAGGPLAVAFETVFSSPIEKRKEEWLVKLSSAIEEICTKVADLTPEKLSQHELFISAYLQASNIAVRTHQKEKLDSLINAVKNSVINESLDETKKLIFIRLIDDMTPLHLRVLHFLTFPEKYIEKLNKGRPQNMYTDWGDLRNVWDELYSDMKSDDSLIELIISELHKFGLVRITSFHEARLLSVATQIGIQFIGFIELES